ncbi:MAG TPA: peptide ABC transporter substrate-binding protein [Candidatus Dormibacteraeota bacterium]|nr:peptide ABC transporter substrate-binding protein [Candidatus Dormibacteraeota bacterium]
MKLAVIPEHSSTRAAAIVALAAVLLATSCTSANLTEGPRLAQSQTLRVAIEDQPQSLDPGQVQYPFERAVLRVISEPLLTPTPDTTGVMPAAAAGYDVTDNGTVYVFHLRKDAQYWDGQPVKAQDFVYAWRRLIDPRLASPEETFFAAAIANGDKVAILDPQRDAATIDGALQTLGLKAVDDTTFQVTLSRPDPAFIWLAAMPAGAPIRQDVVTKYGDSWSASPDTLVSNGPFRLSQQAANQRLTVVPNPHYWGSRPTLKSIEFDVINDGAEALARYRSGDIDVMAVQPAQAATVAADRALSKDVLRSPALTAYWITFRVTSPRLANPRVRQALAEAIDRSGYVSAVFQGQGRPLETFIPEGMRGYAPELSASQKFDVAQARATLAAAGVSAAQLSGLKFSFDNSVDFARLTAQYVRDQLKANLGIDIVLEPLDTGSLGAKLENGSFDIAGPLGWNADYPDPADWFPIFTTTNSYNYSLYQNSRYDSLVAVAATDSQASRRDAEYSQAQRMLLNDSPAAFLAQSVSWYLVQPYVKGLAATSVGEWPGELFPNAIYIAGH